MTQDQLEKLKAEAEKQEAYAKSLYTSMPAEPKPWAELSIEEKIERLRERVKRGEGEERYIYERISALQADVSTLCKHQHSAHDGQVLLPPRAGQKDEAYGQIGKAVETDPAKVYF